MDTDVDYESAARSICLRLLTARPRTRAELSAALSRKGVPEDAAEAVLSRLGDVGLIDDAAYAAAYVESRHRGRGLARGALRQALRQRGVADEDVASSRETLDPEREAATAAELVRRKLGSMRTLDRETQVRRLTGMLARKGYPMGVALRVIRSALDEQTT